MQKALSELAIIIIGVLIALFAESAWSERSERADASRYEERLQAENDANRRGLEGDMAWSEMVCRSAGVALAHLRGESDEFDANVLLNHAIAASVQKSPAVRRSTYDDLIATGRFGLLPDPQLREAIVDTYASRDAAEQFRPPPGGAFYLNLIEVVPGIRVRAFIDCLLDPSYSDLFAAATDCITGITYADSDALLDRLLQTSYFERNLADRENWACGFVRNVEATIEMSDRLARMLDGEDQ